MKRKVLPAAVTALMAAVLLAVPSTPAQAASSCGSLNYCMTTWFTNSSHTTVAGRRIVNCDGTTTFWGTVTGYPVVYSEPC